MYIGLRHPPIANYCRIDTGFIHLIGKLMVVKLKSPETIFFPIYLAN